MPTIRYSTPMANDVIYRSPALEIELLADLRDLMFELGQDDDAPGILIEEDEEVGF
jgi:hypothetical protein